MTKQEINNEIKSRQLKTAEILDAIKSEKREMTNVEDITLKSYKSEIADFELQLREVEKVQVNLPVNKVGKDHTADGFNLLSAIRDVAEGRQASDATIAMNEIGRKSFTSIGLDTRGQLLLPAQYESRADIIAGTDANGKYAVPTDKLDLIAGLRANSVLFQAGAQLMSGLQGNISLPVYGNSSVAWKGEVVTAVDGASTFSEITMSPKRITGYIDISKQFLQQTSPSSVALLNSDLIAAVQYLLESTAFGIVSGNTTQPAGIFYGASYGSNTGSTTYAKIVALESAVNTANALKGNSLAYVTTPAIRGVMKTTPRVPTYGGGFIIDGYAAGDMANGYPVFASSAVNAGKVAFGNWNDLMVGSWGGLDILTDVYSQALLGKVRLVINAYFDIQKRRTASFAYANLT
jgi:HK97 family phage major capsid protein